MTRTARTPKPAYIPRITLTRTCGVYRIESESRPGTAYTVDAVLDTCDCPASGWGKVCKHRRFGLRVWEMHRRLRLAARQRSMEAAGAYPVAA